MFAVSPKYFAVSAISLALIGCGAGGSTTSPVAANVVTNPVNNPAINPQALSQQSAGDLVKSAVDVGNSSTQLSATSASFATAASEITVKSVAEKAIQSVDCVSNPQLSSYCVGQVVIDSNLSTGARVGIPAGTYLNVSFNGFRPLSEPADQAITGSMSISFLDAFTSSSLLNGTAKIKLDTTSPKPEVHTDMTMIFKQLYVTGAGTDLSLNGAASLVQSGQPNVDVAFATWRSINSRPQVGSKATMSSAGETVAIQVVSLVGTLTNYDVTVTSGGVVKPTKRVTQDVVGGVPNYKVL
jgi:hypothetical protein